MNRPSLYKMRNSEMTDTYEICSTEYHTDRHGDAVCEYHFLINGAVHAYLSLNEAGEYQDGTFKQGSDPTRAMLQVVHNLTAPETEMDGAAFHVEPQDAPTPAERALADAAQYSAERKQAVAIKEYEILLASRISGMTVNMGQIPGVDSEHAQAVALALMAKPDVWVVISTHCTGVTV